MTVGQKIADLENQKSELEALIKEAKADKDVVGCLNFTSRLGVVIKDLNRLLDD